ncbi:MAG TPA: zf-HC2 domain-containing protein [Thermomicrobiaceae bacterium]|nr:zf-HC2 domain-containing protein [Thermomicrobiaceae bacterium]
MMDCDACGPLLSGWMDDDLEPDERRAVARHLIACAACRERLRSYGGIRHLLRSLPRPEPPRSVARTFHARLTTAGSHPALDGGHAGLVDWGEPPA